MPHDGDFSHVDAPREGPLDRQRLGQVEGLGDGAGPRERGLSGEEPVGLHVLGREDDEAPGGVVLDELGIPLRVEQKTASPGVMTVAKQIG